MKQFYFVPFCIFFYISLDREDISIATHSPGLDLEIFIKVYKDNSLTSKNIPKVKWPLPTKLNNDFASM